MLSPVTREFIVGMKRITGNWQEAFRDTIAFLAVNHAKTPRAFPFDKVKEEILTLDDLVKFITKQ
jgi:hypothetical protein